MLTAVFRPANLVKMGQVLLLPSCDQNRQDRMHIAGFRTENPVETGHVLTATVVIRTD